MEKQLRKWMVELQTSFCNMMDSRIYITDAIDRIDKILKESASVNKLFNDVSNRDMKHYRITRIDSDVIQDVHCVDVEISGVTIKFIGKFGNLICALPADAIVERLA